MHLVARAGLVAVAAAVIVIAAMDLVYLAEVNPLRRTISEHGLGPDGRLFGLAVGLIGAGSAAIAVAVAGRGLVPVFSIGMLGLLAWSAGMLLVALFPKHDWSVGPSLGGSIHRVASVVAFLALPIAALLISRGRRFPAARAVAWLGLGSLVWVAGIGGAIVFASWHDLAWWQVMPLGAVERGLALFEIATLAALGVGAARDARVPALGG